MGARRIRRVRDVEPREWPRVVEAARVLFPEDNAHGVFAFGIGRRVTGGVARGEVTLNVYVPYKHRAPAAAVPDIVVRGGGRTFALQPNVIAVGRRARATLDGPAPFSGLYPGAPIRADGPPQGFGGVACFVGQGETATHFVTAGHLFPVDAAGTSVSAAADAESAPVVVGHLAVNLLDAGLADAAAIELTDDGIALMEASEDGPRLKAALAEPSVFRKAGRAFRPTTHDFSRTTQTAPGPTDAFLEAETRGAYWVRGALATDGTITDLGDSGTVLCTGSNNQFAMAVLVGEFHAQSIAEPLGRVIRLLSNELGDVQLVAHARG